MKIIIITCILMIISCTGTINKIKKDPGKIIIDSVEIAKSVSKAF